MPRLPLSSLRARFMLLVALATLPMLGLVLYTAAQERKHVAAQEHQHAMRLAQLVSANQARLTEGTRQLLITLSQLPAVEAGDPNECSAVLAELLTQLSVYTNLGVVEADGDVVCSALPMNAPVNVADRSYFRRAIETRSFAIGDYQIGRITGKPGINFAYPIIDDAGQVQRVVFAALDLAWLNRLAQETVLPEGTVVMAVDHQGMILARHPEPEEWVGQRLPDEPIVGAMTSQQEGTAELPGLDNVPRLYAFTPLYGELASSRASVAVGIPSDRAFAASNRILASNLTVLALAVAIGFLIAWFASNHLVLRWVNGVMGAAHRLGEGDLSARAGPPYGPGELGHMARTFDHMADTLQARQADIARASQDLRESEERFEAFMDNTPTIAFIKDAQGRYVYVNRRMEDLFNLELADLQGKTDFHWLPEETARRLRENDQAVLATGTPIEFVETMPTPDGTIHHWLSFKFPISSTHSSTEHRVPSSEFQVPSSRFQVPSSESPIDQSVPPSPSSPPQPSVLSTPLLGGVSVDITERKHAEEALLAKEAAEQANRAKSEFLSRMSHELRTPLNSILGFSQLLQLDNLTPQQQQHVQLIIKGGKHLLDLINEVLEISRIEAGKLTLSPEPISVHNAIEEVLDLVAPLADNYNIKLHSDILEQQDLYVLADRQRLKQVLLNLLSNAIKYNRPQGSVTLSCETAPSGNLCILVSDTGPGIPPEKIELIFLPFQRLGAEQSGVEGTGLGLALSKGLVQAMGGTIGVESVVGQGSTFWIELAVAESQLRRLERLAVGPAHIQQAGPQRTILYIEDNLSNLILIERILERRPEIKLLLAMQGSLGVQLARQHRPDLILLDLHLPDLPGDKVLHQLREDPQTSAIPVIIVSADATPNQVKTLLAAGAAHYLTKPLDVKQFLLLLDQTLYQ